MRKLKVTEMNRLSVEQFKQARKLPLIVVLDDVRSRYNVGAVFRCGDAFRVEAIWLCGITATPPDAEIHKTALGGEDSVDWRYFESTEDALHELHKQQRFVYSVEQVEGSTKLQDLDRELKTRASEANNMHQSDNPLPHLGSTGYAVVFGNEVKGVKQSVVDLSDGCLEIPQFGTKHSLNVASTVGIVMWEFAKQEIENKQKRQSI